MLKKCLTRHLFMLLISFVLSFQSAKYRHAQYILWANRGFFLLSEGKNKNKNLLAGCRRQIRVIRDFDYILTENFVKKSPDIRPVPY